MLLGLILKSKELQDEHEGNEVEILETAEDAAEGVQETRKATSRPKRATRKREEVIYLSSDKKEESDDPTDSSNNNEDDNESWTEEPQGASTPNKNPSPKSATQPKGRPSKSCVGAPSTTLVIAPLSLITQWEEELASKTNLSHLVYYNANSKKLLSDFSCLDVVVTTYGVIQSEFVAKSRGCGASSSPLLDHRWRRVILDEGHGIKNPATVVSKSCCSLEAQSRWCVTGTPVQNSLQDVYGLLKFLRHEPWCEGAFWKNAITNCSLTGDGHGASGAEEKTAEEEAARVRARAGAAFARVRRVLAPIILRRTKDTLTEDGTPILTLPPIEASVVRVELSPPEREFYNARE